jgi:Flp pilus assembly pilin Flp
MIEKALLLACVALMAVLGISAIGSSISKMMTKTECAWAQKTICVIEDPNAPNL